MVEGCAAWGTGGAARDCADVAWGKAEPSGRGGAGGGEVGKRDWVLRQGEAHEQKG